ncbi:MAG: DUF885 domain-containing protein [Staphylothermus sp.]|nr:DUF885 domain-containing protein [Staphylothermus sp.]
MSEDIRVFDKLIHEMIGKYLELNPVMGTSLGLHEYDSLVVRIDKKWLEQVDKLLDEALEELSKINPENLDKARRIDYTVLVNSLKLSKKEMKEWPLIKMMPSGVFNFGEYFTPLITRSYLPREHVLFSIESRLVRAEDILLGPFELLEEPYQLWLDLSLQVAQGNKALLQLIKAYGQRHGRDWSKEVEDALDKLEKAIEMIKKYREKAKPGFKPIGKELFEERLKLSFIPESAEEIRQLGYREAEKYRKMIMEVAKEIGANSIEEALEKIKTKHPKSPEEVFEYYKKAIEMTRKFIVEKNIIEPPIGEDIEIIETPPHLKPYIPFAAYINPEIFHYSNTGLYLVTKPENEEMLKHFNWYDVLNTTVHEAYPGHHIQLCYAKNAPTLLRKTYFQPTEFIEGWAHYTEWLMLEEGIDTSPEYRLKVLHDALWRAVRVYVDVELSTGMITFEEAVQKLVKDAYLPQDGAVGEVLRYTFSPGYQLCYNYGKRKILELRERVKQLLGEKYSHKLFHKLLLEEGNLPINILSEIVLEKAKKYASK